MELSKFSKNSYRSEKMRNIQSLEDFGEYNGLLVNLRQFGNQKIFRRHEWSPF